MQTKSWTLLIPLLGIVFSLSSCYSLKKNTYYEKIDTYVLKNSTTPAIKIEIDGDKYPTKFDLGSKLQLTLPKNILKRLKKKPHEKISFKSIKGDQYFSQSYIIPSIKLGNLTIQNVVTTEENFDFEYNNQYSEFDKKIYSIGKFGSALLFDKNILLNFKCNKIIISNDYLELKKQGYNFFDFVKIPYTQYRHVVVITINTDIGPKRLAIDTGCTMCCIRSKGIEQESDGNLYSLPYINTEHFIIAGWDFGNEKLCLYDVADEYCGIDGFLGMSFLKDHVVYIDRDEQMVYIK